MFFRLRYAAAARPKLGGVEAACRGEFFRLRSSAIGVWGPTQWPPGGAKAGRGSSPFLSDRGGDLLLVGSEAVECLVDGLAA